MVIGLYEDMIHIDFGFSKLKVKVTGFKLIFAFFNFKRGETAVFIKKQILVYVKLVSAQYLENHLLQNLHISHGEWSVRGHDPYWFWVQLVKGQVHRVIFCKKRFLFIILRTISCRAFIFHIIIGLYEDMIPTGFGFTRSKVKVTEFTYLKIDFHSISWKLSCNMDSCDLYSLSGMTWQSHHFSRSGRHVFF